MTGDGNNRQAASPNGSAQPPVTPGSGTPLGAVPTERAAAQRAAERRAALERAAAERALEQRVAAERAAAERAQAGRAATPGPAAPGWTGPQPATGEPPDTGRDAAERLADSGELAVTAARVREQFAELTGLPVEGVTGARPDGEGWSLLIDVVELDRIPKASSVLATYRVDVTGQGRLRGWERIRRFTRSAVDQR